jgi:hypothetical protein
MYFFIFQTFFIFFENILGCFAIGLQGFCVSRLEGREAVAKP